MSCISHNSSCTRYYFIYHSDPQDDVPFAEVLYTHDLFFQSLYNSLSDKGIMVLQLGVAPYADEPPDEVTKSSRRAYLSNSLESVGFQAIHVYEESHCQFGGEFLFYTWVWRLPFFILQHSFTHSYYHHYDFKFYLNRNADPWTYLVAMKDVESNYLWYKSAAEIDVAIHERTLKTISKTPTLKHFDGSTMLNYQQPHKSYEVNYCTRFGVEDLCPVPTKAPDVSVDDLEVRNSEVGPNSGRGVFTKVDIPKGSTIAKQTASQAVHIPPSSVHRMSELLDARPDLSETELSKVLRFVEGYGKRVTDQGNDGWFVGSSILTFINHGCFGSYNLEGEVTDLNEQTYDGQDLKKKMAVFNLWRERHMLEVVNRPVVASKDIRKGEELLGNYLSFAEKEEDVMELKRICSKMV